MDKIIYYNFRFQNSQVKQKVITGKLSFSPPYKNRPEGNPEPAIYKTHRNLNSGPKTSFKQIQQMQFSSFFTITIIIIIIILPETRRISHRRLIGIHRRTSQPSFHFRKTPIQIQLKIMRLLYIHRRLNRSPALLHFRSRLCDRINFRRVVEFRHHRKPVD